MRQYDKYKDSGIEWLSAIPKHWEIRRVKDIFTLERGKFTHRPRNDQRMYSNGTHPFIQTGDVAQANKYVLSFKQTLNNLGIKVSKKFTEGTIVMSISANIGDVAILSFDCYFPDSLVAFITKYDINYFYYLLVADKHTLDKVKTTNTQDNINLERLNSLEKIFPPLIEQTQIANYLDKKTKAIDQKIQLLQQKINHYKEYKKSLINEAVCKGLDKDVKMKDSGVEWIGEIPEHWKINQIKRSLDLLTDYDANGSFASIAKNVNRVEKEELKYAWFVRTTDLEKFNDKLNLKNSFIWINKNTYEYLKKSKLFGGELLLAKRGDIGKIYLMPHTEYPASLAPNLYLVRFKNDEITSKFAFYFLSSSFGIHQLNIRNKSTTLGALYKDDFKSLEFTFPPVSEQNKITNFLDRKCNNLHKITQNLHHQIKKLSELKKTLINDVVTGKIKVV